MPSACTSRGAVEHATINRWGLKSRPAVAAAFHRRKRPGWRSWRLDEAALTVKGA